MTDFLTLRSNIFTKTKKFAKLFLSVRMVPTAQVESFEQQQNSRDTVSLSEVSLCLGNDWKNKKMTTFNSLTFQQNIIYFVRI